MTVTLTTLLKAASLAVGKVSLAWQYTTGEPLLVSHFVLLVAATVQSALIRIAVSPVRQATISR